ncbi:MAG: helix-turn-helix domain-containing protein [Actinomycetota bacterium]|nr:helix-turn-helix domain-containing protein [Actinomycetota bacterium]
MDHPLFVALAPLAEAVGGTLVLPCDIVPGDVRLEWDGELVGGFRLPFLAGALDRVLVGVERELGGPLEKLSREAKQTAVRVLQERGAFTLRKSVEDVADALGVSRFTVYNYLHAIEHKSALPDVEPADVGSGPVVGPDPGAGAG